MTEFTGPIQPVALSSTLWLIPFLPLLIGAFSAACVLLLAHKKADDPLRTTIRNVVGTVAVGAMLSTFALAVYHVVLVAKSESHFLLCHLFPMVRIGQFDSNMDFALDPLSSVMLLVITGVGSLIFVYAAKYMEHDGSYARFFTYFGLFVFSMLLLVLGDNFFVLFFGWEGVGFCSWGLIGFWWTVERKATAGMKAFLVNRVGDLGLVVGIALIFWGLGGSWGGGEYTPELNARFSAVRVTKVAGHGEGGEADAHATPHASPHGSPHAGQAESEVVDVHGKGAPVDAHAAGPTLTGKGYLTVTSHPGSLIFMDDARTPMQGPTGTPLTTPFVRFPVEGGLHTFLIHAGSAVDDHVVRHVALGGEQEVALVPFGPTVTFRQIRDQFAAATPKGDHPALTSFRSKTVFGGVALVTLACLALLLGGTGKSAQIPLFIWLPDAMAGPTPVSALIHAATMVTAGVYMVARLSFLFGLSHAASATVALVGALTALSAAFVGFFQYDLKKILAYSTISQLGFMFLGAGVGNYTSGIFHVVTHAFFKACLFLAAGSVIHGMHHLEHDEAQSQDVRNMGGMKKMMPHTARTYFIATLAITAAPIPGLAGFWSKDEILLSTLTTENIGPVPGWLLTVIGLIAATGTSYYMWRSYYVTFEGKPHHGHEAEHHVHESPAAMTGVLWALAGLSIVGGVVLGISSQLIGGHGESILEEWMLPSVEHHAVTFSHASLAMRWGLMVGSVSLALGGWYVARSRYGESRQEGWDKREQAHWYFEFVAKSYRIDGLYETLFVNPAMRLRLVLAGVDRWVVDGIVNGSAVLTRAVSWVVGKHDQIVVDGAVNGVADGVTAAGSKLRLMQSGRIDRYVFVVVVGIAIFLAIQFVLFEG